MLPLQVQIILPSASQAYMLEVTKQSDELHSLGSKINQKILIFCNLQNDGGKMTLKSHSFSQDDFFSSRSSQLSNEVRAVPKQCS